MTDLTGQAETASSQFVKLCLCYRIIRHETGKHQIKYGAFRIHDAPRKARHRNLAAILFVIGKQKHGAGKYRSPV